MLRHLFDSTVIVSQISLPAVLLPCRLGAQSLLLSWSPESSRSKTPQLYPNQQLSTFVLIQVFHLSARFAGLEAAPGGLPRPLFVRLLRGPPRCSSIHPRSLRRGVADPSGGSRSRRRPQLHRAGEMRLTQFAGTVCADQPPPSEHHHMQVRNSPAAVA